MQIARALLMPRTFEICVPCPWCVCVLDIHTINFGEVQFTYRNLWKRMAIHLKLDFTLFCYIFLSFQLNVFSIHDLIFADIHDHLRFESFLLFFRFRWMCHASYYFLAPDTKVVGLLNGVILLWNCFREFSVKIELKKKLI